MQLNNIDFENIMESVPEEKYDDTSAVMENSTFNAEPLNDFESNEKDN